MLGTTTVAVMPILVKSTVVHFVCTGGTWIPFISWFIGKVGEVCVAISN